MLIPYRIDKLKTANDKKDIAIHEEKQNRRVAVARQVERRKALQLQQTVDDLFEWIDELHGEINDAKQSAKKARKDASKSVDKATKASNMATKRLKVLKDMKYQLNELQDKLADESQQRAALERMQTLPLQINRERLVGRKGGASHWPVHIVLLICELLVNRTPPSAVPGSLKTFAAFSGITEAEYPTADFVRKCRLVLQILNETLSALRLGNAPTWHQLFTDGTSRRQVAFHNLVIGLMMNGKLDPCIVSSCMILKDETAEHQVEAIELEVSWTCSFLF